MVIAQRAVFENSHKRNIFHVKKEPFRCKTVPFIFM